MCAVSKNIPWHYLAATTSRNRACRKDRHIDILELIEFLVSTIRGYRYSIQNEMDFHKGLEWAFTDAGIAYNHEHTIEGVGVIDFFVDGIGIEVKTSGSPSAVVRQMYKYMKSDEVKALILVTTQNRHRGIPREIHGKPITLIVISPGLS